MIQKIKSRYSGWSDVKKLVYSQIAGYYTVGIVFVLAVAQSGIPIHGWQLLAYFGFGLVAIYAITRYVLQREGVGV